ncbi:pseudouridine synthase [Apilactobacillus bombintestini]|uniref:Pseudouridine synthase n=1 Tax=Apilactobacillus bombintestini TaxID=2419772 RepID=A0A387AZY5_9LACO|nr:pseudouridine synthase [Apilactobacillus bombintestini]AYF92550.1 rRNA pseudouridine synthase [Apilactobacillus bombintestini]
MAERLQKVMAKAGVASRRKSEGIIQEGRVKVNGQVVTELGTKVKVSDEVMVDGLPINKEEPVYFLLYKPRRIISSASDEKKRKTVLDFFPDVEERIYPVGRLDYDTSGLILLTNDGELDNRLTHPKYEVDKTYVAKVEGIPTNDELKQLRLGVVIHGKKTSPAKTNVLETDKKKKKAVVQITIHEGKNHEVKNMFKAIGHPVEKLKRESYAFLNLRGLQPGDYRPLKKFEVDKLYEITEKK